MALTTYPQQVDALKRWMREGLCRKIGTWTRGLAHGDLWVGEGYGYRWHFETVDRLLVPGSFRVTCIGKGTPS